MWPPGLSSLLGEEDGCSRLPGGGSQGLQPVLRLLPPPVRICFFVDTDHPHTLLKPMGFMLSAKCVSLVFVLIVLQCR